MGERWAEGMADREAALARIAIVKACLLAVGVSEEEIKAAE